MHERYVTNKQAISFLLLFCFERSRCQNFPKIRNEIDKAYSKNNWRLIDCNAKRIKHCTKSFIFELQEPGFKFTVAFFRSLALAELSSVVGKFILERGTQTNN